MLSAADLGVKADVVTGDKRHGVAYRKWTAGEPSG
jgi:hypothetical protein